MRKAMAMAFAVSMGLACSGCIMVIGAGLHTAKVGKHKRLVEINDELYLVDLQNNTARKLDTWDDSSETNQVEITEEKTGP